MRRCLVVFVLLSGAFVAFAEDAVERLDQEYDVKALDGLIMLHERQIGELEKVEEAALEEKNQELVNRAGVRIEELQKLVIEKKAAREERLRKREYPQNSHYFMTYANDKLGTEKGARIICHFSRQPFTDFAGEKLVLELSANSTKYADTPNEVFVVDLSTDQEVGKIPGIRRGQKAEIPLSIPAAAKVELAIMVKGGDALHLKPFKELIPDVYLTLAK